MRDLRAEREARSLAIEKAYVHDVYEQVGTQEYLILNLNRKRFTKFRLQNNAYLTLRYLSNLWNLSALF